MAVPKRKTSKAKTASRKAANMKRGAPGVRKCDPRYLGSFSFFANILYK